MADDLALGEPHTVVVIGGGQAAGWIVKTLRKEGFTGRLVMIADEIHLPYERPPLSKAVLSGDADINSVRLVSSDDFAALNVETWQPDCAMSIDRERKPSMSAMMSNRGSTLVRLCMRTAAAPVSATTRAISRSC